MTVTKRTRFEVLKRDNHTCRYCGSAAPDVKLTVDHVTPLALGGNDNPDNLVAACQDCNAGKASTNPDDALVADVAADALRWARAQERAAEIRLAVRQDRDDYTHHFHILWMMQNWGGENENDHTHPRPYGWETTLWRLYAAGFPASELEDAVLIACSNMRISIDKVWLYFCGVCWRKLDEINATARRLLAEDEGGD